MWVCSACEVGVLCIFSEWSLDTLRVCPERTHICWMSICVLWRGVHSTALRVTDYSYNAPPTLGHPLPRPHHGHHRAPQERVCLRGDCQWQILGQFYTSIPWGWGSRGERRDQMEPNLLQRQPVPVSDLHLSSGNSNGQRCIVGANLPLAPVETHFCLNPSFVASFFFNSSVWWLPNPAPKLAKWHTNKNI